MSHRLVGVSPVYTDNVPCVRPYVRVHVMSLAVGEACDKRDGTSGKIIFGTF